MTDFIKTILLDFMTKFIGNALQAAGRGGYMVYKIMHGFFERTVAKALHNYI